VATADFLTNAEKTMKYIKLPFSDLQISPVCLGMMSYGNTDWQPWVLSAQVGREFVTKAFSRGLNFFDTSDFYSFGQSEEILGEAVRDIGSRENFVIATKVGLSVGGAAPQPGGLHPDYIYDAADASLERLGLDHIDLYQLHGWDPAVPIVDTLGAMQELKKQGKIRAIGVSNFSPEQLQAAMAMPGIEISTVQSQYNLLYRGEENAMMPVCAAHGISMLAYSPLARGRLAGLENEIRTKSESQRANLDQRGQRLYADIEQDGITNAVRALAEEYNLPSATIALAWLLSKSEITSTIFGATEESHLDAAIQASQFTLKPDEIKSLEQSYQPVPLAINDLSGGVV
jgi:1-deoxyxylulose-5-phosphate synthase